MIVLNRIVALRRVPFALLQTINRTVQLHVDEEAVVSNDFDGVQDARQLNHRDVVDVVDFRMAHQGIGARAHPVSFDFEPCSGEIRVRARLAEDWVVSTALVSTCSIAQVSGRLSGDDFLDLQRLFDAEGRPACNMRAHLVEPILQVLSNGSSARTLGSRESDA